MSIPLSLIVLVALTLFAIAGVIGGLACIGMCSAWLLLWMKRIIYVARNEKGFW